MKAEQIEQAQSSFEPIRPIAADAAASFYKHPQGDWSRQVRMLMSTLGSAGNGLTLVESLAPVFRQMGARHAAYGVKKKHYAAVGAALFWTLQQALDYYYFTPDVRWAWAAAFELLSSTMQAGAGELRKE